MPGGFSLIPLQNGQSSWGMRRDGPEVLGETSVRLRHWNSSTFMPRLRKNARHFLHYHASSCGHPGSAASACLGPTVERLELFLKAARKKPIIVPPSGGP
jgi:hypothetical protein